MAANPLLWGALGRCANCGEGWLFEGFLKVSPRCEPCGFDLAQADSGDGPAVFVILIAGFILAFGALFTMAAFRAPVWLTLLIWLPMTLEPFPLTMDHREWRRRALNESDDPVHPGRLDSSRPGQGLAICLALVRPMKGLMLAAQFMNKAGQARHD